MQAFPSTLRLSTTYRSAGELRGAIFNALATGGFEAVFPAERPDPSQRLDVAPVIEGTIVGERIDPTSSGQRLKGWLVSRDAIGSEIFAVLAALALVYVISTGVPILIGVGVAVFVACLLVLWFNYYNRSLSTTLVRLMYAPEAFSSAPRPTVSLKPGEVSISYAQLTSRNEGRPGFQFERAIVSKNPVSPEAAGVPQLVASLSSG